MIKICNKKTIGCLLLNGYEILNFCRDDGEKNGLNLLNIQSFADPSITCSATLPPAGK